MSTATHPSADRPLEGTWQLESWEIRRPDGTVTHPLGQDPIGRISYDAAGRMAVQVMRRDRTLFASGDVFDPTPDELAEAWAGSVSYAGTYTVDVDAGTVTHDIQMSSFPNWVDDQQVRFFALDGDVLELTTAPMAVGGTDTVSALVWVRDPARK